MSLRIRKKIGHITLTMLCVVSPIILIADEMMPINTEKTEDMGLQPADIAIEEQDKQYGILKGEVLQEAQYFNFVIFKDHIMTNGDSVGPVAVGGNAIYNSYGLCNTGASKSEFKISGVVAGNLEFVNGGVGNPVIVGQKSEVTGLDNSRVIRVAHINKVIDFEKLEQELINVSDEYTEKLKNSKVTYKIDEYNPYLIITYSKDNEDEAIPDEIIVDVSSINLNNIKKVTVEGITLGTRLVINSSQAEISLGQAHEFKWKDQGKDHTANTNDGNEEGKTICSNVLWNFSHIYYFVLLGMRFLKLKALLFLSERLKIFF